MLAVLTFTNHQYQISASASKSTSTASQFSRSRGDNLQKPEMRVHMTRCHFYPNCNQQLLFLLRLALSSRMRCFVNFFAGVWTKSVSVGLPERWCDTWKWASIQTRCRTKIEKNTLCQVREILLTVLYFSHTRLVACQNSSPCVHFHGRS